MSELPMDILTDAGFTPAQADSVVRHLKAGVNTHDDRPETERLDLESLPPEQRAAIDRFTKAVAADV